MIPLLLIDNLHLILPSKNQSLIDSVSFSLYKNHITALIGESGSGKTIIVKSILRLLPPAIQVSQGEILYNTTNLLTLSETKLNNIRANHIAMIFQDPYTFLNPTMKIGKQIMETMIKKQKIPKKKAQQKALNLLQLVEIDYPIHRFKQYPHELSGGQQQRIMIAIALSANPKILIADEPSTSLDVITQKKLLLLLKNIQKKMGLSILFITHDLNLVRYFADDIIILHNKKIIEKSNTKTLFSSPSHPYTKHLIKSNFAHIDDTVKLRKRLEQIQTQLI